MPRATRDEYLADQVAFATQVGLGAPIVAAQIPDKDLGKQQPMVMLRGLLVFFSIVLTLATIEILFRCTIYERRHSRRKTRSAG